MRKALRAVGMAFAACGRKVTTGGADGWLDELLLALALALVTAGLWPWIGQGALVAPGVVLLWIALPQRAELVHRSNLGAALDKVRRRDARETKA